MPHLLQFGFDTYFDPGYGTVTGSNADCAYGPVWDSTPNVANIDGEYRLIRPAAGFVRKTFAEEFYNGFNGCSWMRRLVPCIYTRSNTTAVSPSDPSAAGDWYVFATFGFFDNGSTGIDMELIVAVANYRGAQAGPFGNVTWPNNGQVLFYGYKTIPYPADGGNCYPSSIDFSPILPPLGTMLTSPSCQPTYPNLAIPGASVTLTPQYTDCPTTQPFSYEETNGDCGGGPTPPALCNFAGDWCSVHSDGKPADHLTITGSASPFTVTVPAGPDAGLTGTLTDNGDSTVTFFLGAPYYVDFTATITDCDHLLFENGDTWCRKTACDADACDLCKVCDPTGTYHQIGGPDDGASVTIGVYDSGVGGWPITRGTASGWLYCDPDTGHLTVEIDGYVYSANYESGCNEIDMPGHYLWTHG